MKILETDFGRGENFLRSWRDWRAQDGLGLDQPSKLLHYVALVTQPIAFKTLDNLSSSLAGTPELSRLLAEQCDGLVPGFHRLMFESGKVLLTLCIGDLKSQLKSLQFQADLVLLTDSASAEFLEPLWDIWSVKLLAKCCRRGTTLTCNAPSPELPTRLNQCGFEMAQVPITTENTVGLVVRYNPSWEPKNTRPSTFRHVTPLKTGHCLVIGAGLAGASVAASMARRGWQCTVLDVAAEPAMGASSLPVGLMVPHVTADDSPRSRLSRRGMRMTLQQAATMLTSGQDWCATGVLERRLDGALGLPSDWLQRRAQGAHDGATWSRPMSDDNASDLPSWRNGLPYPDPAVWHGKAAWIKPASLVRAWLAQPGIQFQGKASVASLTQSGHQWLASDAQGRCLAAAELVVIANAGGAIDLLTQLTADLPAEQLIANALAQLQTVEGQVSWAMHRQGDGDDQCDARQFPPFPVNGLGSLVANVPMNDGQTAWFAGATFEREGDEVSIAAGHQANLARLQTLLPASGRMFADQLGNHEVNAWRNTRCTSTDRMPLCGPLCGPHYKGDQGDRDSQPSLWLVSALGARGLSLAVLCAELLAARVHQEPLPIEAALAKIIDINRKKCLKSPSNIDS